MLLLIFDWGKLIGTLESLALEKKKTFVFPELSHSCYLGINTIQWHQCCPPAFYNSHSYKISLSQKPVRDKQVYICRRPYLSWCPSSLWTTREPKPQIDAFFLKQDYTDSSIIHLSFPNVWKWKEFPGNKQSWSHRPVNMDRVDALKKKKQKNNSGEGVNWAAWFQKTKLQLPVLLVGKSAR